MKLGTANYVDMLSGV